MSRKSFEPIELRRTDLVPCDDRILSIYSAYNGKELPIDHKPQDAWPQNRLGYPYHNNRGFAGLFPADVCKALLELHLAVEQVGGRLRLADGRRAPDAEHHESWHHSGRAIDISLSHLDFPETPERQWLAKFWELAKPIGWKPIIPEPNPSADEAWHFEFRGEWEGVLERTDYRSASRAALLDCGLTWEFYDEMEARIHLVQGQIQRIGIDCGKVDGILGRRTRKALEQLDILPTELKDTRFREVAWYLFDLEPQDKQLISNL